MSVSQLIREALTAWVKEQEGIDLDFNVGEWGGNRTSKTEAED